MKKTLPLLLILFLLTGCAAHPNPESCTVLFEDNPQVYMHNQVFDVTRGQDLTVTVMIPSGQRIASVSYPEATVSHRIQQGLVQDAYQITLARIRYPVVIRIGIAPDYCTVYHINNEDILSVQETSTRLRINTLPWSSEITRPGYLPVGWMRTDTGETISFGSRFDHRSAQQIEMEPVWLPCSDSVSFTYRIETNEAVITGYIGTGDLVIPAVLDTYPVIGIDEGAFGCIRCQTVALPPSLRFIATGAFDSLEADDLYLFDGLTDVTDAAFGSYAIERLHINAMTDPVYCGSYFDTLSEKLDYLRTIADEKKIILFGGSSVRFGYDCAALEAAFPEFKAVNMGVFAYANMLPQARLIAPFLKPGDIILSSPELDAIREQFCGCQEWSSETFAMAESDYDMLVGLDCRDYTGIFDAFRAYQRARSTMTAVSYNDVPAYYDEDRHLSPALSYNRQGDYILHRPANMDGKLFGIKRACYNPDYIQETDWQGLNAVYDTWLTLGVSVFFTYSPRSSRSITSDSTPESIAALDWMLRERLHVPVISDITDSLMDAKYFFDTDNHLTSEGAALRTARVIEDLRRALEVEP